MRNNLTVISIVLNTILIGFFVNTLWHDSWRRKELYANIQRDNTYRRQVELHAAYESKNFDVVMLGDSITYGVEWVELLGRYDVANRGISGDTTKGVLNRIEEVFELRPKVCFVMIGVNDFFKGANVNDVFANYVKIVDLLKTRDITTVIQSTLYISSSDEKNINKKIKELNSLLSKYAEQNRIRYVDLNFTLGREGRLGSVYTYDGIHLSAKGYMAWKNAIAEVLKEITQSKVLKNE